MPGADRTIDHWEAPTLIFFNLSSNIMKHFLPLRSLFTRLMFVLIAFTAATNVSAQSLSIDFKQAANDEPTPGKIEWVNGIVNSNNSIYYEGMAVPQRIILDGLVAGQPRTIIIRHQTLKSAKSAHAYDFLTSWENAEEVARRFSPALPLLADLFPTRRADASQSLSDAAANCNPSNGAQLFKIDIPAPSANPVPTFGSGFVWDKKTAFDAAMAKEKKMSIWVPSGNTISNATFQFIEYRLNDGDQDAVYELTFTPSGTQAAIEFASHLASGVDYFDANIGWGLGKGSGDISGASYHVYMNGDNIGNKDNQVQDVTIRKCNLNITVNQTNNKCFGESKGALDITVTGGDAGNTYTWTGVNGTSFGPVTTQDLTGLANGSYKVDVTDASGFCKASQTYTITSPTALEVSASTVQPKCFGENTGSITLTTSGGTAPYTFGNGPGSSFVSNPTFTALSAGTYTFFIKDANGCILEKKVDLGQPSKLVVTATPTAILCNRGTSTVTVSATGGTGAYTGTGEFTKSAGIYTFTVTDENNCTASATITITEPTKLEATATPGTILCNGGTTTVTITATGGTAPYTGTGDFTKGVGTHKFTITDANGCSVDVSVTLTEPTLLTASSSATDILCNGEKSTVTVSANGGTAPYVGTGTFQVSAGTHKFTVTDANGCETITEIVVTEPAKLVASSSSTAILCNGGSSTITVSAAGGKSPYTGTGTFTVTAGTYTYKVTDANGCESTTEITVTEPTKLEAKATPGTILCNGGTATVTISATGGTAPYTGIGDFTKGAGTYTFTVTDANGCSVDVSVTLTEPTLLTASSSATKIFCNGDKSTVTVTASGGTLAYSGTGTFQVNAGTYEYTVTDKNGCTAKTSITITEPSKLVITQESVVNIECKGAATGKIVVSASGGTLGYSYSIDGTVFSNTSGIFEKLKAGSYTITVKDGNDCKATLPVTITESETICFPLYTYSQGYYGQSNGVACILGRGGLKTAAFIAESLGTSGMTLGSTTKKFVVPNTPAAIAKLIEIMPGGGAPAFLTGSSDLSATLHPGLLTKTGKISTVLLGQTVAMWLNVNIPGNVLGSLDLIGADNKNNIISVEPSTSNCLTPAAGTVEVKTKFPQTVVIALKERKKTKGGTTVKDLVDLASEALGGNSKSAYGASLADINTALDAIVAAFHSGKYFVRFEADVISGIASPMRTSIEESATVKVETFNTDQDVKAFPNPYVDHVTFNISVKNAGKGSLVLYNAIGQKVANVFEGDMQANSTQTIRYSVPVSQRKSLVYVFRQNGNTSTGRLVSGK